MRISGDRITSTARAAVQERVEVSPLLAGGIPFLAGTQRFWACTEILTDVDALNDEHIVIRADSTLLGKTAAPENGGLWPKRTDIVVSSASLDVCNLREYLRESDQAQKC